MKANRGDATRPGCWDVLIRAGLILAIAVLCYQVFLPFLTLMVWAAILAVSLFGGATLLALGYQIFMGWVAARSEVEAPGPEQDKPT